MSDIVGYIAGLLLIINFIPQIYQTYKTKQMKDVSLVFIIFNLVTCCFQMIYCILIEAPPLIIANSIVFIEILLLLYAKLVFKDYSYENIDKVYVKSNAIQVSDV